MKKERVVNKVQLVGNKILPKMCGETGINGETQPIHLDTVRSFGDQKYFSAAFSHSLWYQTQTGSLIHSTASLL
jgi:hypothetical protein